jgi:NADP-reducing hydrogenase subunit HndB
MNKIASAEELIKRKTALLSGKVAGNSNFTPGDKVRIRVHMGTSGIASGAKEVFEFLTLELEKRNIDAVIIKTGDLGYSYAEPTIEVKLPGEEPLVFGNVDKVKADEIIQKYIRQRELVEGIIPNNYRTI